MEQESPDLKYPQVTQAQLEIWLADPVTKTYLQCLEWNIEQNKEYLGKADWVTTDPDENSHTLHSMLGEREGLVTAICLESLLMRHNMLEPLKEVEDEA